MVVFKKKARKLLPEYIASRDKPPEKNLPPQNTVLDLEYRILSQEPADSCILYLNVIFHAKQAEEDTNQRLLTFEFCENLLPWFFPTVDLAVEVDTII